MLGWKLNRWTLPSVLWMVPCTWLANPESGVVKLVAILLRLVPSAYSLHHSTALPLPEKYGQTLSPVVPSTNPRTCPHDQSLSEIAAPESVLPYWVTRVPTSVPKPQRCA